MTMNDAMQRMSDRVPRPKPRFFTIVLAGPADHRRQFGETLAKLSGILRSRKKMREKVRRCHRKPRRLPASSAHCRLWWLRSGPSSRRNTASAYCFTTSTGHFILGIGVSIMATGVFVMRKMINFDM